MAGRTMRPLDSPAFVKPCLKSNENEGNDTAAVREAPERASMRCAWTETPEPLAGLRQHHGRWLLVRKPVPLSKCASAILCESGISLPQRIRVISKRLPDILKDADNDLPILPRHLMVEVKTEQDQRIVNSRLVRGSAKGLACQSNGKLVAASIL